MTSVSNFKCNLKPKRKKPTPALGDPIRPGSGLGVLIDLGEYDAGTGTTPGVEDPPISRRRSYMQMSSMFSEGGRRHSFSCVPTNSTLSQSFSDTRSQLTGSYDAPRRGSHEVISSPSMSPSVSVSAVGKMGVGVGISNMSSSSSSVKLSENPMKTKKQPVISSPNSPTPAPLPKGTSNSHVFGGVNMPARGDGPSRQSSFAKIRNRMHFDSSEVKSKRIKRKREIKKKRKVNIFY